MDDVTQHTAIVGLMDPVLHVGDGRDFLAVDGEQQVARRQSRAAPRAWIGDLARHDVRALLSPQNPVFRLAFPGLDQGHVDDSQADQR